MPILLLLVAFGVSALLVVAYPMILLGREDVGTLKMAKVAGNL